MKLIPANGGPVQLIVAVPSDSVCSGTWAPDGTILFSMGDLGIFRVSATSGTAAARPESVTKRAGNDWSHFWPCFLPDGRRFLFTAKLWTGSAESSEQGIYLGSLDSPEKTRRLLPDISSAVYARPGYIVFARNGMLMGAPFNLDSESLGEPEPLGMAVAFDSTFYMSAVSAAADGTLAVRPPRAPALGWQGTAQGASELHLMDRAGRLINTGVPDWYSYYMALAPDNLRAAVMITDPRTGTNDLWMVHMQTGTRTPLTTSRGFAGAPVWSSDGERLAYAYQAPGQRDDVYVKDLRTGKDVPVIQSPAVYEHPLAWSRDGASLLVDRWEDVKARGIFVWSFASQTLTPFIKAPGALEAVFSPDDRYVAFSSLESGRREEVYVTTFPERRQTWPLTTEGGRVLSWSKDGHEILVATLSGDIAAYPVGTDGGFTAGKPSILIRDVGITAPYSSASPDHSRILIRVNPDSAKDKGEIRLLFGWAESLQQGRLGAASR